MYLDFIEKNLKVVEAAGDERQCFCPLHENAATSTKPSFSINIYTGKWKCFSRCGAGSLAKLCKLLSLPVPKKLSASEQPSPKDEVTRYVDKAEVEGYVRALSGKRGRDAAAFLTTQRGISPACRKLHEIGLSPDGRITIPVRDHTGGYCNIRRYDWLKVKKNKFLNYAEPEDLNHVTKGGYGSNRLYPHGVVEKHAEIMLFEGELDCLLARSLGFDNAVTTLGGAGNWEPEFTRALAGKKITIVYDIDDAGVTGAESLATTLRLAGCAVSVIRLPISEPKNGDFTDYLRACKWSPKPFLSLLATAAPAATRTNLQRSSEPAAFGKPLGLRAVVSGKDLVPFVVPAVAKVACRYSAASQVCGACPIRDFQGRAEIPIPVTSDVVLKAVDSATSTVGKAVSEFLDLPGRCPGHKITIPHTAQLWDVRLSNDLDTEEGREEGEHVARRAFSMVPLQANVPYELDCVATADPKSQYALLQILKATGSQTSLEKFTTEGKEQLLKLWEA